MGRLERGPSDIIGTNKPDGAETAAAVLEDVEDSGVGDRPDLLELLDRRAVTVVDRAGWLRLEEHEGSLGLADGRGRVKVHDLGSMLRHSTAVTPPSGTAALSDPIPAVTGGS